MKSVGLIALFAFLIGCVFFGKTTKSVEKPITVEKTAIAKKPVCIEKRVEIEKIVEVPVRVEVEKRVEVPVEKRIFVPVPVSPRPSVVLTIPPARQVRPVSSPFFSAPPRIAPLWLNTIVAPRRGFVGVFNAGIRTSWAGSRGAMRRY